MRKVSICVCEQPLARNKHVCTIENINNNSDRRLMITAYAPQRAFDEVLSKWCSPFKLNLANRANNFELDFSLSAFQLGSLFDVCKHL